MLFRRVDKVSVKLTGLASNVLSMVRKKKYEKEKDEEWYDCEEEGK